jgi:hypothetical protein
VTSDGSADANIDESAEPVKLTMGATASASDTAPDNVDAAANRVSYSAGNVLDGDPQTVWRVSGDGRGVIVTLTLPSSIHLTEVGLIPGYAKVDASNGVNRFPEKRRSREFRWRFDDGTAVEQRFNDSPTMQPTAVDGTTSSVTIEVLSNRPGDADHDYPADLGGIACRQQLTRLPEPSPSASRVAAGASAERRKVRASKIGAGENHPSQAGLHQGGIGEIGLDQDRASQVREAQVGSSQVRFDQATFFDKEWLVVDNNPGSPFYGRAYVVAARFLNALQGAYAESPVYFAYSDDGGRSWSEPKEISGSNALCTFQNSGPAGECDENGFPIPDVAPNGDLIVHFQNGNIESAWETPGEYESTLLAVKSTNGGATFGAPVVVANLEDGAADTPWSVIGRQTVTGHQIRWQSPGTITADPTNANHWVVVYNDNFAGTHDAAPASCLDEIPGTAPDYNPCAAVTQHQHLHGRELERRCQLDPADRRGHGRG